MITSQEDYYDQTFLENAIRSIEFEHPLKQKLLSLKVLISSCFQNPLRLHHVSGCYFILFLDISD